MTNKQLKKVGVAMSGGVDSSTTALLLKQAGYEVVGITGNMTGDEELLKKAKYNCDFLGIEHYVLDLREEFQKNCSVLLLQQFPYVEELRKAFPYKTLLRIFAQIFHNFEPL